MGKISNLSKFFIFLFLGSLIGLFVAWIYNFEILALILEIVGPISCGFLIYFTVRDLKKVSLSKGTNVSFILFLVSISALLYGVLDLFYFWFYLADIFISVGLLSAIISGSIFTYLLIRDRKKQTQTHIQKLHPQYTYSTSTKVFFWIFIGCLALAVVGFVAELYFWSGIILLALGSYGAMISGIVLLILFLRDRITT